MSTGIYLTLSGGGYRATAFHAGTLWVLEKLGLLGDIWGISSASGGTLFAARYLKSLHDKQGFAQFFDDTLVRLPAHEQRGGARGQGNVARHKPDPRSRTLIVGAADVYAEPDFVGDMTFADVLALQSPLKELSLNATEFRSGITFRFLRSAARAAFGNGNQTLPESVVPKIRLADIVAASSAFPGGFEPMAFPQDFSWGVERQAVLGQLSIVDGFETPLALMDGGIDDNQGITSLSLAIERTGVEKPELVLVSDVHPWAEPLYKLPTPQDAAGLKLVEVAALGAGAWLFSLIAAAVSLSALVTGWDDGALHRVLTGIPFGLSAAVAFALSLLGFRAWRLLEPYWHHPQYRVADYWGDLRELKLTEAFSMLELRGTSLLALTSSVFMKRVRSAVQKDAISQFGDARLAWSYIYNLWKDRPGAYPGTEQLISAEALECVEAANGMPTLLWARSARELRAVVATGRLTTCAALLRWLGKQETLSPRWLEIREQAQRLLLDLDDEPLSGIPSVPPSASA